MTKGAPQGNSNAKKQLAQNGPFVKGDTAETIAKEHNIGRNTVKRAEKFDLSSQKVKNRPRCCSTEDGICSSNPYIESKPHCYFT